MLSTIKKVFSWIGVNSKWLLLAGVSIILTLFGIGWYRNKNKIEKLKNQVYILQAKLKIEALSVKHDILIEDLATLKEKEGPIKDALEKIEKKLNEKVPDMTIEEIAQKFREI